LQDWMQSLVDRDASQRRRDEMNARVQRLVNLAGWKKLSHLTADSAFAALAKLQVGTQTRNHYIQHIKQFAIWCVDTGRLPSNPLLRLKPGNVRTDRRHDRRELTAEEQASLVIRYKLDGPSRALLYEVAFATGFRRGELRSLTRESFDLETDCVTVAAAYSKHRRQDVQPLPRSLVSRLRQWFAEGKPLWPNLSRHTARMLKSDLADAAIPYVIDGPDGPLYADFHSTRHTFVSAICRTNAPIKDLVDLARHSDPRLTLKTYAHAKLLDKAKVINQLPDPRATSKKDQQEKRQEIA
jgi:integrase